MRPTFFLTRVLAISVLFVGAARVAHGAPIAKRDHAPLAAVAAAEVETANVVREPPVAIGDRSVNVKQRVSDHPSEPREEGEILKRMCFFIWGCK